MRYIECMYMHRYSRCSLTATGSAKPPNKPNTSADSSAQDSSEHALWCNFIEYMYLCNFRGIPVVLLRLDRQSLQLA